jgi:hypothetical protein
MSESTPRPTLRVGSSGAEVRSLQQALATAEFYRGTIDGRFGGQTYASVRAFQAARGLPVDGVVGPQTWDALLGAPSGGEEEPSTSSGGAKGLSLHIGLNSVNPAHYAGWSGILKGCENDARDMEALAKTQGFVSKILLSQQATANAIIQGIEAAAGSLSVGDIFFLTYSGHGGQVPNVGASIDDPEEDNLDETWCLYDRQLLDDELGALWLRFKAGVRIVVLDDSCHSGTILRAALKQAPHALASVLEIAASSATSRLRRDLCGEMPRSDKSVQLAKVEGLQRGLNSIVQDFPALTTSLQELGADPAIVLPVVVNSLLKFGVEAIDSSRALDSGPSPDLAESTQTTRNLPIDIQLQTNQQNAQLYRSIQQDAIRAKGEYMPAASVLLGSACQDNQTAADGVRNGLFTETLLKVWDDGSYRGDYRSFLGDIQKAMPPWQSPNYYTVGTPNPDFEHEQPFSIKEEKREPSSAAIIRSKVGSMR